MSMKRAAGGLMAAVQIIHKALHGRGGVLFAAQRKGNIAVSRHVKLLHRDTVWNTLQDQLRQDADTQAAFHH